MHERGAANTIRRDGIRGGNLEREAREVVGRVGLHLLDLLEDPLHRRVLQVVLVLRHVGSSAAADDPEGCAAEARGWLGWGDPI